VRRFTGICANLNCTALDDTIPSCVGAAPRRTLPVRSSELPLVSVRVQAVVTGRHAAGKRNGLRVCRVTLPVGKTLRGKQTL